MRFSYEITHTAGKNLMTTDTLSRIPGNSPVKDLQQEIETDMFVRSITGNISIEFFFFSNHVFVLSLFSEEDLLIVVMLLIGSSLCVVVNKGVGTRYRKVVMIVLW